MNLQQTLSSRSKSINIYEQVPVFKSKDDREESCKGLIFDMGMRIAILVKKGRMKRL